MKRTKSVKSPEMSPVKPPQGPTIQGQGAAQSSAAGGRAATAVEVARKKKEKRQREEDDCKLYTFTVQFRIADDDGNNEEVIFKEDIKANRVHDLFKLLEPKWLLADKQREAKCTREKNYWLFVDCEEVIRNADGESYWDDDEIPQGPEVADALLEFFDR